MDFSKTELAEPASVVADNAISTDSTNEPDSTHNKGPAAGDSVIAEVSSTKKEFSVQVDLPGQAPKNRSGAIRLDKAVQTHFERWLNPIRSVDAVQQAEPESDETEPAQQSAPDPAETVKQALMEAFEQTDSIQFSDLRLGIRSHRVMTADTQTPFILESGISEFLSRPVAAVATTKEHPELLLVAYKPQVTNPTPQEKLVQSSKLPLGYLPGLAVLYSRKLGPFVPEFLLQCTSPITVAQFDVHNPFRIYCGLKSGRIAMWDLQEASHTQVAMLPTLQTTTVASSVQKSARRGYVHHTSPIVHLEQHPNLGLISICAEGVINVWSPDFLAFPKFESIRIRHPTRLQVAGAHISTLPAMYSLETEKARVELKFLNKVALATGSGSLLKLANEPHRQYVQEEFTVPHDGPHYSATTSITQIVHNSTMGVWLTAHVDWAMRIWGDRGLLVLIPTNRLIKSIVTRAGHWNHIVTVSEYSLAGSELSIELWDLDARLTRPMAKLPVDGKLSAVATFSDDGAELIVAYNDGDVDIWKVEDLIIERLVLESTHQGIDEGILPYIIGSRSHGREAT